MASWNKLLLMSITSYFVLVLLCLSLHECNARSLQAKPGKGSHFSNKSNDPSRVSIQPDNIPLMPTSEKESKFEQEKDEQRDIKTSTRKNVSVTQNSQSVSWRMPHEKKGEKDPGFNLDYLPPKTHPPVHN